jgi:hypothetical protein
MRWPLFLPTMVAPDSPQATARASRAMLQLCNTHLRSDGSFGWPTTRQSRAVVAHKPFPVPPPCWWRWPARTHQWHDKVHYKGAWRKGTSH